MTSVSLQERLEEATADLSRCQVASDVAEILRVEGVQGERRQSCRCPLSVLIIKRLGPGIEVNVTGSQLQAWPADVYAETCWVRTPAAVVAFVREFDGDPGCSCGAPECSASCIPGGWDEFAVASP